MMDVKPKIPEMPSAQQGFFSRTYARWRTNLGALASYRMEPFSSAPSVFPWSVAAS